MLAEELEKEQKELHEQVEKALRTFSERTGLAIEAVRWSTDLARCRCFGDGESPRAVEYYEFSSQIGSQYT